MIHTYHCAGSFDSHVRHAKQVSNHTAHASVGVHLEQVSTPRHKQGPIALAVILIGCTARPLPIMALALEEITVRLPVTGFYPRHNILGCIYNNQIASGLHHNARQHS